MKKYFIMVMCLLLMGGSCKKKREFVKDVIDISKELSEMKKELKENPPPYTGELFVDDNKDWKPKIEKGKIYNPPCEPCLKRGETKLLEMYEYPVGSWNAEGECLWVISLKVYGDADYWHVIYKVNMDKIPHPDVIYEGDVILIPVWQE